MRIVPAALAAVLLLAAPASAAAEIPAGNLLLNPGADAGAGATDSDTVLPLPNWTVESSLTAVRYGAPAFPPPEDSTRLGGRANFFAGGPGGDVSSATQVVDVSRAAPEIDAGRVTASLSALIGGYSTQDDAATVTRPCPSQAGAPVTTLGPVTQAERAGVSNLLPRAASFPVPAGTRSIRVTITATRAQGNFNDGYVDNVALSLTGPPVAGQSVGAKVVSGTVLVRSGGQFVPLTPTLLRNGAEIDARRGAVEITRADGGVAKFYDGMFKLSQSGGITDAHPVGGARLLAARRRPRGAEETQAPQAVGRRQGQVPHQGPLRRRDRARHQVARVRHLHLDDDARHAGLGQRARPGQEAHGGGPFGQALRGSEMTASGPWTAIVDPRAARRSDVRRGVHEPRGGGGRPRLPGAARVRVDRDARARGQAHRPPLRHAVRVPQA